MLERLKKTFVDMPIVLEEQDNRRPLPGSYVVGDELDGTAIYARGMPEWALTLAYVEGGKPVAGVMHQPALARTVITWRGGGSWLDDRRVVFHAHRSLDEIISLFELNQHLDREELLWFAKVWSKTVASRCLATAVGSTMEMLAGKADLYLNCRGGKVWDFAAASLAIEEAGGVAMTPDGSALKWGEVPMGVLFATNMSIAVQALQLAKAQ